MIMRLYVFLIFLFSVPSLLSAQNFRAKQRGYTADFIRYLNNDGVTYKDYIKIDSERKTSWHYIEKGRKPDEVFSFTSPREYDFQPMLDENYNRLWFESGSFSLIREDSMREELLIRENEYIFQNDYTESREGYYGFCAAIPEGFEQVNYVWVFPDRFDVTLHESNVEGTWTLVDNTLSFTASNVNNILFKIRYKLKDKQPVEVKDRTVTVIDTFPLTSKRITISIWDDSKVDSDVISLKVNDEWLIKYLEAKKDKTTFKYILTQPENYIVIRADDIGVIPPNTTALEVSDGKNKHMIVLNADLGKSEAIKINLVEPKITKG